MIVVLAMAPSGEVYFTRDEWGQVWEHGRLGALQPLQVNEAVVDRAVVDDGFVRLDVEVGSYGDVDAEVAQRIATTELPDLPVNRVIARGLLSTIDDWLASPADRHQVIPLINRLLQEDAVRNDEGLLAQLLDRNLRASSSGTYVPFRGLLDAKEHEREHRREIAEDFFAA